MNNERFKIARYIKEFIMVLDAYLENYPKKYFELRNKLVFDSYELLELVYLANYNEGIDRKKLQFKSLMKINIIDFYIEESYKKRIISEKQSIRLSKLLMNINKMMHKWINDEKC